MFVSKYDIQKLQELTIESVAEKLNIPVSHHKAICPFHDDTHASLTFHRQRNRYRCYVCDAHGGPIDLVMNSQGWSFTESCQWLAKEFGVTLSNEGSTFQPRAVKQQKKSFIANPSSLTQESPDIPYLERLMAQPIINEQASKFLFDERKISQEVVRKIGISSIAYSCPMSASPRPTYYDGPALLIPYRDMDGKLLSVQSRYLGDSTHSTLNTKQETPRFRFPKGSKCTIFNLPVLKDLKANDSVFITEGVTDCLAIQSAGFKSIAIPSATLLSDADKQLLSSLSSRACPEHVEGLHWHMYPDNDEPGEKLYFQLKDLLSGHLQRHDLPAGYKDVGQYWAAIHRND